MAEGNGDSPPVKAEDKSAQPAGPTKHSSPWGTTKRQTADEENDRLWREWIGEGQ